MLFNHSLTSPSPRRIPLAANREANYQYPAHSSQTGSLNLFVQGYYRVINCRTRCSSVPHGTYIFVIPFNRPDIVLVMPSNYANDFGHTSLTQAPFNPEVRPINYNPDAVCYAGQIEFFNGELREWNNNSGHYHPPVNLHSSNLSATAAAILPASRFKPHKRKPLPDPKLLRR